MSEHGECFDTGQAGNCGSQGCCMFQRGECSIPKEILENEAPSLSTREYLEICKLYNISLEKPMNTTEVNAVSGRVETKGLFRTKFDLGDTFWVMQHNVPLELYIYAVALYVTEAEICTTYTLNKLNDTIFDKVIESTLSSFTRTKEELMNRIFSGE